MINRNSLGNIYPIKKLGDVADFLDSRRKPVKECDRIIGPYPYYGANGLQGWINDFLFDENLILLAEDGGHFDNPDRGVAYKISGKTWVNNHAHVIKPKEGVDLDYLCRVLENYDLTPWITGTTRGKLTKGGASEILIPLPPLAEQRRIASILDQADELRQKRQQAIEKLDQLLQSTFIEMFGDPVSNPKQFICKTLEQISCFENGDRSSNYPSGNDLVFAGIPFLSTKNIRCNVYDETNLNFITEEKFSSLSRGKVKNNEILITLRGTLGATCIFKSKYDTAFINAQMMIIRSDPLIMSNDFLHAILSFESMQEYFRRVGQGAAVPQLTATELKKLEIIIPSIELQNEFLRINQEIQKLKNEFSNSFSKYDLLFKTLQNQAFNGTL